MSFEGLVATDEKSEVVEQVPWGGCGASISQGAVSDLQLWFPGVTGPKPSASFQPPLQFSLSHRNKFQNDFLIWGAKHFVIKTLY